MIYLVRHGQTDINNKYLIQGRQNHLLNDTGRAQAKAAASKLEGIKFDLAFSSPLDRAYETCSIILATLDQLITITKDANLLERDFGASEGKPVNSEWFENTLNGKTSGQELNADLEARAYNAILNIAKNNPEKDILIVSHAHFIKGFLISMDPVAYDYHYHLPNTSIVKIDYKDNKLAIIDIQR